MLTELNREMSPDQMACGTNEKLYKGPERCLQYLK